MTGRILTQRVERRVAQRVEQSEAQSVEQRITQRVEQRVERGKNKVIGCIIGRSLILLLMGSILISCDRVDQGQGEILVGAAASLGNVMEELQTIYKEQNSEVTVTFTFAGSGSLEQQIREGAPIDVFLSAAEKQMDALEKDDLILSDTRVALVENQIVLIVPQDSKLEVAEFEDVLEASMIALGNPDSVPVGQYAQELFEALGIWEEVYAKSTFGKDVTEVLAWVGSGEAEAGVVYATDAVFNKEVIIIAIAPEGSHSRAIYPGAIIKGTKEEIAAKDFLRFLQTNVAKEVFIKYGFKTID
ncbi:MAG: molybdate ABC transporter substrate-binding protein [Mobilitalea sp.]